MHVGLFAPFPSSYGKPPFFIEVAQTAERLGFHSIWAPEHVLLFDEYASRYPYTDDGRIRLGSEPSVLEPFNFLSFIAGATSTIRLGTGICLVPQRNPVYTAKEVATLDYLSGGRVDFGVGIGWLKEEFAALGVPWPRRAQRTRSYLEVMKRLWCDPISSYDDDMYTLPEARQYPKPVQQPHPPIHFGGESDAALKRVADIGQGWYGFSLEPEQAKERIAGLSALLKERGRDISDVFISVTPGRGAVDPGTLQAYRDAGVQQLIVSARGSSADLYLESLAQLAREVVEPASAL
jgi:probable F420-dependent oxidoreductase